MNASAPALLPESGFDSLARLCKAAGDPLRLEILRVLRRDSFGVLELCEIFGLRQPAMSHHLKVLAEAGLVSRRREATSIFYQRNLRGGAAGEDTLRLALFAAADQLPLRPPTLRGIEAVRAARSANSRAFFAANADKFHTQQELIAPRGQYADAVTQMLEAALPANAALALELGPGDGWLLPLLARRARRVVAIDNSPVMLEQARATLAAGGLAGIELRLGDSASAAGTVRDADVAVLNMVLHHTPSPAGVLHDLAETLRPGGRLLLTDLCAHDQAWAREACGDLWLGFAAEDLLGWTADAGLLEGPSTFLALRNGFRIQLRIFEKPS